jgi:NUMOD4 motif
MERWKPVESFKEYEVSTKGRIRRRLKGGSNCTKIGKFLKPRKDPKGYLRVVLCKNGTENGRKIHRPEYVLTLVSSELD